MSTSSIPSGGSSAPPAQRSIPWGIYTTGAIALLITVLVVAYPEDALDASVFGLKLWFDVVLPALFPFFTLSEILMGLGIIHFGGVLLEPAMRPLFRIPGVGGFVVAIGLASGYPLGAKITSQICRQGLCTPVEGERLIAFANTADPLFIVGAVAIGMFHMPEVGGILVASHYVAVLLVGLLMRFHAGGQMGPPLPSGREPDWRRNSLQRLGRPQAKDPLLLRALQAMMDARRQDGRPLGQLFGDAVRSSLQSMLFVGGCIMMFSVFLRILTVSGILDRTAQLLASVLAPLGWQPELISALLQGTVEITIGTKASSELVNISLTHKLMAASAIIGWSGLGVHAQVAAMVFGTGIRMGPYVLARLLHGVLAALVAWILAGPAQSVFNSWMIPVLAPLAQAAGDGLWPRFSTAVGWGLGILAALGVLAAVATLRHRVSGFWVRS